MSDLKAKCFPLLLILSTLCIFELQRIKQGQFNLKNKPLFVDFKDTKVIPHNCLS